MSRYRYQFPIRFFIVRDRNEIGIGISLRKPIVRIDDGSISIFLNFLDE
jgi:hypothetical protein